LEAVENSETSSSETSSSETLLCPICDRSLGSVNVDEHHLIPKSLKGKEKIKLHRVCHDKIHASFTERELAAKYNTISTLRESEEIGKFVKWISKKSPEYLDKSIESNRRNGKRKK
jgi:hypothetical protein